MEPFAKIVTNFNLKLFNYYREKIHLTCFYEKSENYIY